MSNGFDDYQRAARTTANYPFMNTELGFLYVSLGLAGEVGELLDKLKKEWRNEGSVSFKTNEDRVALAKELGDVLWYLSQLATELGLSFDYIRELNLAKLKDRQARNVIKSIGDAR